MSGQTMGNRTDIKAQQGLSEREIREQRITRIRQRNNWLESALDSDDWNEANAIQADALQNKEWNGLPSSLAEMYNNHGARKTLSASDANQSRILVCHENHDKDYLIIQGADEFASTMLALVQRRLESGHIYAEAKNSLSTTVFTREAKVLFSEARKEIQANTQLPLERSKIVAYLFPRQANISTRLRSGHAEESLQAEAPLLASKSMAPYYESALANAFAEMKSYLDGDKEDAGFRDGLDKWIMVLSAALTAVYPGTEATILSEIREVKDARTNLPYTCRIAARFENSPAQRARQVLASVESRGLRVAGRAAYEFLESRNDYEYEKIEIIEPTHLVYTIPERSKNNNQKAEAVDNNIEENNPRQIIVSF